MENENKFVKDRCPSCTGDELIYNHLTNTYKCAFCGSEFKKEEDQYLRNQIDEASKLRNHLDFDEALVLLEELIAENPDNAALYFQRILSRYGVTYVDEDENLSSKPTLCRASQARILDSSDYSKVKQYAPKELREFYLDKLEELEELRNDIIKRASKQQPFDVFICYKKSVPGMDAYTYDSGKAREIYDKLTKSGYNVFFAEETLADFTGQEYEPVIYNALYSSRVMLVIAASDPGYVKAPWVKNEWSRYLSLIETEGEGQRALVPICCNGFKPEDLPAKLSKRQIIEYDGSFVDKITKVLKKYVKRGVSTNITRNSNETKIEVKPIEIQEVVVEKRGFGGKSTEIVISPRETTDLKTCREWLEHKKFKNVITKTADILKNNNESQEAAWLYIMATINCADLDAASDFYFTRLNESKLNDFLSKVEIALSYCDEREYRTRADILRSIIIKTIRYGDYQVGCRMYSFFITLVDDKYENSLAMAIVEQLRQKIQNFGTQIREKEVNTIKDTLYNSLTKLGAKGIISVYNTIASELLQAGSYKLAIAYYDLSIELFKADPDALWGKMLAEHKSSNDLEFAKRVSDPHIAIDNVILMQKGGYKLGSARRNYLMRLKDIGVQLLNTSNAKKTYTFFKDIYSLIPASSQFTDLAYELAITFSELLLLKGYYNEAEEFFKLIIAEHDQLDFTAHLGILKCKAKVKSNFELLAIKKSYYEYYKNLYDNIREAEEESYNSKKIDRRIFTELDTFHEEMLDMEQGKSNLIKALNQAATVCEKNLVLIDVYDTLYFTQTGKNKAISGNKFAISDLVYAEQEKNTRKVTTKSSYDSTYESDKAKSNVKLFDKAHAINFKVELIFIIAQALAGLSIGGMIYSDYLSDGFPLVFAIIFGVIALAVIIIIISQMKEKCCQDFDPENMCGSCLGWYFGGGIAGGLAIIVIGGVFMGIGALGAYLLGTLGLNIPLRIIMLLPYLVYKIIDIIKKKKYVNAKYIIFSIAVLVLAYIAYGYILKLSALTLD